MSGYRRSVSTGSERLKRETVDNIDNQRTMVRTKQGFFVDVWVGFHVLFLAALASIGLMLLNVLEASSGLVVTVPLALALVVVVGRSSFRLFRSLT